MTLDVSLQAHMPEKEGKGGGMEEGEERNLLKAFEETRYLIEDLDHANGKPHPLVNVGSSSTCTSLHRSDTDGRCGCDS